MLWARLFYVCSLLHLVHKRFGIVGMRGNPFCHGLVALCGVLVAEQRREPVAGEEDVGRLLYHQQVVEAGLDVCDALRLALTAAEQREHLACPRLHAAPLLWYEA